MPYFPSNISFSLIPILQNRQSQNMYITDLRQVRYILYSPLATDISANSVPSLQIRTPIPSSMPMASSSTPSTTHLSVCSVVARSTIGKFAPISSRNTRGSNSLATLTIPFPPCSQKTTLTSYTLHIHQSSPFPPSMAFVSLSRSTGSAKFVTADSKAEIPAIPALQHPRLSECMPVFLVSPIRLIAPTLKAKSKSSKHHHTPPSLRYYHPIPHRNVRTHGRSIYQK